MSQRAVSYVAWGVVGLSVAGAFTALFISGFPAFLLGLAAGALSLVIVLMWASLQQMGEDGVMGFEQALSYAAPSAEEEQKRALLRTLKDLEYELSVGKISREDYDQVSAEVREKAKRVIALNDESMKQRLQAVEARLAEHEKMKQAKKAKAKAKKAKAKAQENLGPDAAPAHPERGAAPTEEAPAGEAAPVATGRESTSRGADSSPASAPGSAQEEAGSSPEAERDSQAPEAKP